MNDIEYRTFTGVVIQIGILGKENDDVRIRLLQRQHFIILML